jgi:hypothetical protein
MTRVSLKCTCGGSMTFRVSPDDKAPALVAIFHEAHSGPECKVTDRIAAKAVQP